MSACNKIRHIVGLRHMLRRWRKKAAAGAATRLRSSGHTPSGHVAVTVGSSHKRFLVRTTYLNHPVFKKLLAQAEEEYGFANKGPLDIPCDEILFEEVLSYLARIESGNNNGTNLFIKSLEDYQRYYCHVGIRSNTIEFRADQSRPLLHEVSEKSVW